jgi:hypothetical protein
MFVEVVMAYFVPDCCLRLVETENKIVQGQIELFRIDLRMSLKSDLVFFGHCPENNTFYEEVLTT